MCCWIKEFVDSVVEVVMIIIPVMKVKKGATRNISLEKHEYCISPVQIKNELCISNKCTDCPIFV